MGKTKNTLQTAHEEAAEKPSHLESVTADNHRLVWIDICKGITILLVVLGHISIIPGILRASIFSFHLPLFVILNGYLIRSYNVKTTFMKSARSLLKPYAVICLLEAVLAAFSSTEIDVAGETLFKSLNDMVVGMSKISTMFNKFGSVWLAWFVCCLFLSRNLYVIIRSVCAKLPRIIQTAIILAVAFLGCFLGKYLAFLPWSLDVAMASVSFIAFGDFLRTHRFNKLQKTIGLAASIICWILLLYKNAWIELATRSYKHGILCFVCAIAGSTVMIAVGLGIGKLPSSSRVCLFIKNMLAWAGKNSIIILGVHCLEMRFFKWRQWIYEPIGISPSWLLEFLIHIALILLVTYGFILLRNHLRNLNSSLQEKNALHPQEKRLDWPDVAKGLCIISIIIGHQGISWINRIVFVYHLPVFFIIAGYFLKKADSLQFAKAKARRLLLPYAVTSTAICLLAVLKAWYNGTSRKKALFTFLDAALYGAGDRWETPFHINSIGAIWFLWALFFALIITNYVVEKKYYRIILASIAFVGWSSFNVTKTWMPLSIQAGMLACVYLLIGYECRKNQLIFTRMSAIPLVGFVLITAFGIQYYKGVYLVHNYYGNGLFDFFVTIAASMVILTLSEYICQTNEWLKRVLSFFGKNSLVILCAHIVDLDVLGLRWRAISFASSLHFNNNHARLFAMLACTVYTTLVVVLVNILKKQKTQKKHV